jgi:hypothetical protein
LADVSQADLDRWFTVARRGDRDRCRGFLSWAMAARLMPAGRLPTLVIEPRPGLTQRNRLDLLRWCTDDEGAPSAIRVAAVLLLLFSQPLTRIRTLTIDLGTACGHRSVRLNDF